MKYEDKAFAVSEFKSLEGTLHSRSIFSTEICLSFLPPSPLFNNLYLVRSNTTALNQRGMIKKQGILNKQGGNYKSWKRRYFMLTTNHLSYYKAPGVFFSFFFFVLLDVCLFNFIIFLPSFFHFQKDPTPVGVIQLLLSSVRAFPAEDKENCFGIVTPARTYLFQVFPFSFSFLCFSLPSLLPFSLSLPRGGWAGISTSIIIE